MLESKNKHQPAPNPPPAVATPPHSISLFLIAYEPINAMLLIRTTSLSLSSLSESEEIPRRVRIVIKRMRNHVLIHFSQAAANGIFYGGSKGPCKSGASVWGLGNHSLWLQPRKNVLTRDFTFPMASEGCLRLAHDGILNSRIKTKFSHHLRQLNSVNLKSQPHSELSSFPCDDPGAN